MYMMYVYMLLFANITEKGYVSTKSITGWPNIYRMSVKLTHPSWFTVVWFPLVLRRIYRKSVTCENLRALQKLWVFINNPHFVTMCDELGCRYNLRTLWRIKLTQYSATRCCFQVRSWKKQLKKAHQMFSWRTTWMTVWIRFIWRSCSTSSGNVFPPSWRRTQCQGWRWVVFFLICITDWISKYKGDGNPSAQSCFFFEKLSQAAAAYYSLAQSYYPHFTDKSWHHKASFSSTYTLPAGLPDTKPTTYFTI